SRNRNHDARLTRGEVGERVGVERCQRPNAGSGQKNGRANDDGAVTQRRSDQTIDERAHHISIAGMAPFLICALIANAPRVTTRSPGASPCVIAIRPPDLEPSWTLRGTKCAPPVLSGWATNTTDLPSSNCTASSGTEGAAIAPPPWAETLASISGLSRSPRF